MPALDPALDYAVDLDTVADQLKTLGYFLEVQGILATGEALEGRIAARPPAAFVAVQSERAIRNQVIGGHSQHFDVEIGVVFVEQSGRRKDAVTDRAMDQLEITKRAVVRILMGFTPRNAQQPLDFLSYRPISLGGGFAWGQCTFATTYRYTAR